MTVDPTYRGGGGVQAASYRRKGGDAIDHMVDRERCLQVSLRPWWPISRSLDVPFEYYMTPAETAALIEEIRTADWAEDIR